MVMTMANQGFKGTDLGVSSIAIDGSVIKTEVHFCDDDGFVHAVGRHSVAITETEAIREATTEFLRVVRNYIAQLHFDNPEVPDDQQEVRHGIAEAIAEGGTPHSDGFEEGR